MSLFLMQGVPCNEYATKERVVGKQKCVKHTIFELEI